MRKKINDYVNYALAYGELDRLTGREIITERITTQCYTLENLRFWGIDRSRFYTDMEVKFSLDTPEHIYYWKGMLRCFCEFDADFKCEIMGIHPTMKTIPLVAYPMSLSSQENSIVLDVFGGSGTTLMAAERLNRICCTIELDPKYASAIVRRFIAAKQGTDEIFVIRNGEKLPCTDVYTPTEDDLAFKEDSVNRE